ncbi:MAG: cation transporter [Firmicutes bacterium]|nr:cation transporter [Bacillota bacterium]
MNFSFKMSELKAIRREQNALKLSMWMEIGFAVLEVFVALITNSQAVLMDAVCDSAETITAIVSLKLVPLLYKPISERRPFGYAQVETWFLVIKGFMLLAVAVGLIVSNVQIILQGGRHVDFTIIAAFEIFAGVVGTVVTYLLRKMNQNIESPLVDAEVSGWWMDAAVSWGLGAAFLLPMFIKAAWFIPFVPYIDQVLAIVLTLFVLAEPARMVISGIRDLMMWAPELEVVDKVKEIAEPILQKDDFHKQFKDITFEVSRMGRKLWVAIYLEPNSNIISIEHWSQIQQEIEDALDEEFTDSYVELLPQID